MGVHTRRTDPSLDDREVCLRGWNVPKPETLELPMAALSPVPDTILRKRQMDGQTPSGDTILRKRYRAAHQLVAN